MVRRDYAVKLDKIKDILLELLGNVEEMVEYLFKSIETDQNLVSVSTELDKRVRLRTKDLLDLCTEVVTLQQPMASDVRLIISAIRIKTDLERSVRDSLHIIELATSLKQLDKYIKQLEGTKEVLLSMIEILKKSLKSGDPKILLQLNDKDEIIDQFYAELNSAIRIDIQQSPVKALEMVDYLLSIRMIERIGDHLCNIAEKIYYIHTAEIIRIA